MINTVKTKIPTREKRAELILKTVQTYIKKEQALIEKKKLDADYLHMDPDVENMPGDQAYLLGWYRACGDILQIIHPI